MRKRFTWLTLAALFVCLGAAPSGAPYVINVISPMTGSGAFLGTDYKEAFDALTDAINRSGGIAGRPVKFQLGDSQTSGQVGLQLANSFIAQHAQVFIDGGHRRAQLDRLDRRRSRETG
jgi:ABC-type branched-subunit amino acid transport system substrate-binding protein